jgi:DNA-directed RNA polymerase subunit RPC12/RpoP
VDSQSTLSVNCNHCGATLEVDENTRFVTCKYCHSRLAIQTTGSAVFTKVLEKLEERTGQIAGNLKVIASDRRTQQPDQGG